MVVVPFFRRFFRHVWNLEMSFRPKKEAWSLKSARGLPHRICMQRRVRFEYSERRFRTSDSISAVGAT